MMKVYHVEVSHGPGPGVWKIHVPELARWAQAQTVDEIEPTTRDLIALAVGEPSYSFELEINGKVSDSGKNS